MCWGFKICKYGNYLCMSKSVKILKFQPKQKEVLSQEEIIKVFGGLVRLIQKSAELTAFEKAKNRFNYYEERLNKTTAELNKRNKQVEELLKLNEELIIQLNSKNNVNY